PAPPPPPAPAAPRDEVLAVGLTPDVVYLATAEGVTTTDPGDAYTDIGTLLDAVLEWMPSGGSVVLDGDTPDLLGFPELPAGYRDYDESAQVFAAAAAAGWTWSAEGIKTWTSWTRADKTDRTPGIATVVLPWCGRQIQRGGPHLLLDTPDEDVATATMLLAEWRHRTGSAYAYNSGSSAVMSVFREYRTPTGERVTHYTDTKGKTHRQRPAP